MWSDCVRKVVEIRQLLQLDLFISFVSAQSEWGLWKRNTGHEAHRVFGGSSTWPSMGFPACLSSLSREQIARVRWCVLQCVSIQASTSGGRQTCYVWVVGQLYVIGERPLATGKGWVIIVFRRTVTLFNKIWHLQFLSLGCWVFLHFPILSYSVCEIFI